MMTFRKLLSPRPRLLLSAVAVSIVALSSALGASGASAAVAPAAVAQHAAVSLPATYAKPSYYLTPSGQRLSVAQYDTEAPAVVAPDISVYHITNANKGYLDGIHLCKQLGSAYKQVEAITCADLYAVPNGGTVNVFPAMEGYCQGPSDLQQCASVTEAMEIANATSGVAVSDELYCGKFGTACQASGRNQNPGDVYGTPPGCDTSPGGPNEFWTVVLPQTIVELPGDQDRSPSANIASQHAIVCG